jgi:hypothetical protein
MSLRRLGHEVTLFSDGGDLDEPKANGIACHVTDLRQFPVPDQSEFEACSFRLRCASRGVDNCERLFAWMQAPHEHNEGFAGRNAESLACATP